MKKLNNLYKKREIFLEYNSEVPTELSEQIRAEEEQIISRVSETVLGYLPAEIEMPSECSVIIGVEYRDGKLVRTGAALNTKLEDRFENVKQVADEENDEDIVDEGTEDSVERQRSKSIGFSVKFADGKIIKHTTAQRTMIEALRYMGLERASQFSGESFKGFPLIGKKQRSTEGKRWQRMVDGWWVYINMSNERKILCLNGVAKMLNISIEIIHDDEPLIESPDETKKRRALYSLNGELPLSKNRSVQAAVKLFIKEMPSASFDEIQYQFPAELQGSYGVVRLLDDIENRSRYNSTEKRRWFLSPADILMDANGKRFTVCTEWGDNFVTFQKHIKADLGWSLEEV